ncbi:MAG TPA: TatD family hydrolase [Candidatus Polarisedimenticolia bacterium]|jgi:TatD DNase family protein
MLADSHAHLSMPAFEHDLDEVVARARAAGVTRVMTCATSMADATENLALARAHGLKASVGFHPHHAKQWDDDSETALRDLVEASPEIAAIGEVGLDYHYSFSPHDTQREVLRRQIALARSVRLPLIIHTRDAAGDLRRILEEEDARDVGGVLHCFSEDAGFARFCLDIGFYVSFSGIITFRKADLIREACRIVPLERMLIETDSPYLAPIPHRGKRNEPALVAEVARFAAELRGIAVPDLADAVSTGFDRLFGVPGARNARSGAQKG